MPEQKRLTRQEAIREKCLDCCCGNSAEVRKCTVYRCPLWRYRMNGREEDPPVQGENKPLSNKGM